MLNLWFSFPLLYWATKCPSSGIPQLRWWRFYSSDYAAWKPRGLFWIFDSLISHNQQAAPILRIRPPRYPTNPSYLLYPGYHYFGWHFCHLLPELNLKTCNWSYCFITSPKYGQKSSFQNTNLVQCLQNPICPPSLPFRHNPITSTSWAAAHFLSPDPACSFIPLSLYVAVQTPGKCLFFCGVCVCVCNVLYGITSLVLSPPI